MARCSTLAEGAGSLPYSGVASDLVLLVFASGISGSLSRSLHLGYSDPTEAS
jgi:hypothetical protein